MGLDWESDSSETESRESATEKDKHATLNEAKVPSGSSADEAEASSATTATTTSSCSPLVCELEERISCLEQVFTFVDFQKLNKMVDSIATPPNKTPDIFEDFLQGAPQRFFIGDVEPSVPVASSTPVSTPPTAFVDLPPTDGEKKNFEELNSRHVIASDIGSIHCWGQNVSTTESKESREERVEIHEQKAKESEEEMIEVNMDIIPGIDLARRMMKEQLQETRVPKYTATCVAGLQKLMEQQPLWVTQHVEFEAICRQRIAKYGFDPANEKDLREKLCLVTTYFEIAAKEIKSKYSSPEISKAAKNGRGKTTPAPHCQRGKVTFAGD